MCVLMAGIVQMFRLSAMKPGELETVYILSVGKQSFFAEFYIGTLIHKVNEH